MGTLYYGDNLDSLRRYLKDLLYFLLTGRRGGCVIGPAMKPYRILIRRAKDGLFFTGADGWTPDTGLARDFEHSGDAAIFAEGRLHGVDILLSETKFGYEMVLLSL